jgi:uncharacterized membrane protein
MMPRQIVYALITFLHDLFTVAWLGGLITLALAVMPALRTTLGMGPQSKKLMDAIQARLSPLIYVSMAGLVITGLLLSQQATFFRGLFSVDNTYSLVLAIKHILVLAMIVIGIYRSRVIDRRSQPGDPATMKAKARLLMVNLLLGILVLLLSGLSAALSTTSLPL